MEGRIEQGPAPGWRTGASFYQCKKKLTHTPPQHSQKGKTVTKSSNSEFCSTGSAGHMYCLLWVLQMYSTVKHVCGTQCWYEDAMRLLAVNSTITRRCGFLGMWGGGQNWVGEGRRGLSQ